MDEQQPPGPDRPERNVWRTVGITLALVLVVSGLVVVGVMVFVAASLNSWASNK
jgi:hypothetical protein